jgi:hypothetical protein
MNAAVVHAFEAPPRYGLFAEPVAADGEILVDVIAAGLHPSSRRWQMDLTIPALGRCLSFPALMEWGGRKTVRRSILGLPEAHSERFPSVPWQRAGCASHSQKVWIP